MEKKWDKHATSCIICGAQYGEYGEYRLVAQRERGFTIREKGNPRMPENGIPLAKADLPDGTVLYAWGELSKPEVLEKLVEAIRKREYPWFCVKCGERVCSKCGAPINKPVASGILTDDYQTLHVPILPAPSMVACSNPECDKHMPLNS